MPTTSWSMLFQGRRAAHTLLLILGIGVPGTGLFIVTTILPSVVADLGGATFYAWPTALYTVAAILGTASGRFIKATLGFRAGYLAGALVFLMGSVGCALAPHMLALVGARTIQGWGGGVLTGLSYGIVSALYPEDLRPRALSTLSGAWGLATLLGPLVGGVFAEIGWWRGAFWVTVPVLMVVIGGVAGHAAVVVEGPLFLLGSFAALTGVGYGLCFAHLNSWTMAAARPGEEDRTASWIPMAQQLGTAFGAAIVGGRGKAAGLAAGMSVPTVSAAATWVYGVSIVAPVAMALLTLRV